MKFRKQFFSFFDFPLKLFTKYFAKKSAFVFVSLVGNEHTCSKLKNTTKCVKSTTKRTKCVQNQQK